MTQRLQLSPEAASVSAGRRFVAECLHSLGLEDLTDTAVLLTSELVTNSVLHARTDIELAMEQTGDGLIAISVHDGSKSSPRRRRHSHDATTGRGMELLERLSQSWDVTLDDTGKTVRFVLAAGVDPWSSVSFDSLMDAEL